MQNPIKKLISETKDPELRTTLNKLNFDIYFWLIENEVELPQTLFYLGEDDDD